MWTMTTRGDGADDRSHSEATRRLKTLTNTRLCRRRTRGVEAGLKFSDYPRSFGLRNPVDVTVAVQDVHAVVSVIRGRFIEQHVRGRRGLVGLTPGDIDVRVVPGFVEV